LTNLISIVLPVHNEYDNLETLLKEWDNELKNISTIKYEFVIVEDGSTDGTKELIVKLENKYPVKNLSSYKKRGYSKAVLEGIKASNGKYILCTDSDNQIKVQSLIENINQLPGKDIFLFGNRSPRNDPTNRIIYSKLFKILHDLLFSSKLSDPSCPFVLGEKETFAKLPEDLLLKMREGFWWGFVGVVKKKKLNFKEVSITHFKRTKGEAGYKITNLPGIIIRNTLGLLKIKFSKN
tara:strand:+ start:175 stop:885 length:711 start_codon:yes stop_codon:yes gene_type:complete